MPGDGIIGYITRGRGVSIHRRDCPNILRNPDTERLIDVSWGRTETTYPVVIKITAYDRGGLLRDIAGVISAESVNMSSVNVSTSKHRATLIVALEIANIGQLSRLLDKIERLSNVIEVQRQIS